MRESRNQRTDGITPGCSTMSARRSRSRSSALLRHSWAFPLFVVLWTLMAGLLASTEDLRVVAAVAISIGMLIGARARRAGQGEWWSGRDLIEESDPGSESGWFPPTREAPGVMSIQVRAEDSDLPGPLGPWSYSTSTSTDYREGAMSEPDHAKARDEHEGDGPASRRAVARGADRPPGGRALGPRTAPAKAGQGQPPGRQYGEPRWYGKGTKIRVGAFLLTDPMVYVANEPSPKGEASCVDLALALGRPERTPVAAWGQTRCTLS